MSDPTKLPTAAADSPKPNRFLHISVILDGAESVEPKVYTVGPRVVIDIENATIGADICEMVKFVDAIHKKVHALEAGITKEYGEKSA